MALFSSGHRRRNTTKCPIPRWKATRQALEKAEEEEEEEEKGVGRKKEKATFECHQGTNQIYRTVAIRNYHDVLLFSSDI